MSINASKWTFPVVGLVSQKTHFICVYTPIICVYTRHLLSRTTSGVCTSFFPGPHLRVSRTPRGFRVTRRILSHRYAVSRNETTCASFHLKQKKIMWGAFFRSYHRNEFLHQVVILHGIPSFPCNINTNKFCFRHFGSCYFGTTVSRMHVRECGLWHGIAVSLFACSCFLLLWAAFPNSCQRVRP